MEASSKFERADADEPLLQVTGAKLPPTVVDELQKWLL